MPLVRRSRRVLALTAAALVLGGLPSLTPARATERSAAAATRPATTATAATTATTAGSGSHRIRGPLHVKGNRILDVHHHPITLRGIDRDLTQYASYGTSQPAVSPDEVTAMHSWGATIVRIPLSSAMWTNWCPSQHDSSYSKRIDRLVRLINRQGMVALLVLQNTTGSKCGAAFSHRAPDAGAVRFWKSAAKHYAHWPLVAFELFNEPHLNKGPAVWRHGQQQTVVDCTKANRSTPTCTAYQPLGEQQLYDAVESTGARNLVVIDTDGWSADPTAVRQRKGVRDYNHNIVYAVHPYQCPQPKQSCTDDSSKRRANTRVLDTFRAVAKRYPIIATEVGWPDPNTGAKFYASTYAYLDRQKPAWGSVAFGWNGSLSSPYRLLRTLGPSYQPSPSGSPVREELRKHT